MGRVRSAPYAICPEWIIDAAVSDRAVRLWLILERYANAEGRAYPGRPKLAERLGCSTTSVDRALYELVRAHAVVVEPHFRDDGSRTANSYWLWPSAPPVEGPLPTGGDTPSAPTRPPVSTVDEARTEPQRNEPQEEEPAADGGVGTDADGEGDPARELVAAFWEWCTANGKPTPTLAGRRDGSPFMALVKIVAHVLDAGWTAAEVKRALVGTRAYTTDAITFQLTEGRKAGPAARQVPPAEAWGDKSGEVEL